MKKDIAMTQEEKAKAYDEALERARKVYNAILDNELLGFPGQIREIFPALNESEDENLKNKSGYYKAGKFWKASTLWNATKDKIPQRVPNRYILQECTWNIGNLQEFANEVKNVQEVSLDYPIILDINGNILDGAHRVVKAYLEGKDIDIVYLGDDEWPEPDYDEEKAIKESEDERIRKEIIDFIQWAEDRGMTRHDYHQAKRPAIWIAYLEKQKENIEKEYVFRPLAGTDITIAAEQAIKRANEGNRLVLAFNGAYIPVRKGCDANKIVDIYDAFIEKQKEPENTSATTMIPSCWEVEQKEPHYTKRNALFDKCVENCDSKTVEEVNKRVDDIMNISELSAFEQALTNLIGYWEDDEERWPSKFVKKHSKHILDMAREELQKEQKPILEVFGFKVGDAVRLKDGDGRKHIIKSFEEVEGIHGPNFYRVEFEDNSARDGIYPSEKYPNGYYTQMEKFEVEQKPITLNVQYNPDDYEVVMEGNATSLKLKEQKVDIDKLRKDLYQSGYNDGYQHGKEDAQREQKPDIEICSHSIESKSYSETGYPIEDCDYGLELALLLLEKTLGKVQGFQTDDGIREHQTAIKAVKDAMKEQKSVECEIEDAFKNYTDAGITVSCGDIVAKPKEQKPVEPSDDELQRYQDELYNFKVFAAKQAREHNILWVYDFEWNNFCAELLSYFNEKQKPFNVCEQCPYYKDCPGYNEQKPVDIAPNQFDGITYGMQGYSTENPVEWSEDYREEDIQTRFAFYTYKDDPSTLYLSNVFVEETSRNHGFGTRILKAAEKAAEAIGATTICLKVKQDSPANAWYRKRGYGYVAFEDGYDWLEKNLEYMKPNKQEWSEDTLDEFTHNIRTLITDKLTIKIKGLDGSEISSTVFIDDKTAKDIANGILFYVGKEAMKNPNREILEWSEEDEEMYARVVRRYTDYEGVIMRTKEESVAAKMLDAMAQEEIWLKSLHLSLKKRNEDIEKLCSNEWSEEDEKMMKDIDLALRKLYDASTRLRIETWLKSLRPQPKVEWSEEDKRVIRDACCWIAEYAGFLMSENKDKAEILWKLSEKLKSLRPSWKPSEEQMEALKEALETYNGFEEYDAMKSLYEQLRKLL